jgi:hypothetical protein
MNDLLAPQPGDPKRHSAARSRDYWKLLNRWARKAPPVAAEHDAAWCREHADLMEALEDLGHHLETVTYFSSNEYRGGWITRMWCRRCTTFYPAQGQALGLGKREPCEED